MDRDMPNDTNKVAYCSKCSKNSPHFRSMDGRFQSTFKNLLQRFRIGPWQCLHCQQKKMILPVVRKGAAEFPSAIPNDPDDFEKQDAWSPIEDSHSAVAVGGFDHGQDRPRVNDGNFVVGNSRVNDNDLANVDAVDLQPSITLEERSKSSSVVSADSSSRSVENRRSS